MELNNQVCSLELSKKLKELGVKQESLFYFDEVWSHKMGNHYDLFPKDIISEEGELPISAISAFTVAELGEMLPKGSYSILKEYEEKWSWQVLTPIASFRNGFQSEMSEADARAKMLIYLLENDLIKN